MTLKDSRDQTISNAAPPLSTGRKWTPSDAVQHATSALRHNDIVGHVQLGRGGFGLAASKPTWRKASTSERRKMVVEEVRKQEEAVRSAKAVSLAKQGQWMRWEGLERRKLIWRELWEMEANNISFIIRATYDVLPSPKNLHQWYGEDPTCALCPTPATLKHILSGCKTSLTQGRYTWRHNQVLRVLAAALESKRNTTNSLPLRTTNSNTAPTFIREGQKKPNHPPTKPEAEQLAMARDWKILVDIGQQLIFPPEIAATTLMPDLVLWSPSLKSVYITELTVPWENSAEEAYERKKLRYTELAADARQQGWNAKVYPVECNIMKGCMTLVVYVAALTTAIYTADARELSITTIKLDPYTMSRGSDLEGYCIDLISELSKKLGFKYNVHLVKDNRYGALDPSGNWNGLIGEVIRGEADLAVAPLTLTAVREQFVEMTTPFMQTGIGFILQKDLASEESHFSVLSPFSTDMWVGVLIAFLLTGLCIFLVARISPSEWAEPETEEQSFTLLHSFWYITGALTLQGAGPHPKALSGRIIIAIWWVFAVLLLACYFANLNSMLHSDTKNVAIESFEDLANQDVIDYGTVDAGSSMSFFKNSNNPVYRRIYQQMERKKSYVSNMEEGIHRTLEGNFAFIGEAVSLDLSVARYCQLTRSQEVIAMRSYSIAAPLGSPLVKNLTVAILQLSESGELTYLRNKWWASSCVGADGTQTSGALQPHNLRGLFLLLGLGLGLGLLLALLDLVSKARSHAKDGKKSCCLALTTELNRRFGSSGERADQETSEKSKA
ncbi:putative glutamate receptor [Diretmus argenteus]